jgi:hypothetical protein
MQKSWKMDRGGANGSALPFDLFAQPFRILRIDPGATNQQVHDAFDIAQKQQLASSDELGSARASIFDPSRRLLHELRYPIDTPRSDIDALYTVLSSDAPTSEHLLFAERLAPLSRANFVAHIVANRSAESTALCALVEAHACIEPAEIYEILKGLRKAGENPPPSLASVNQGLQDLLDMHAQAVIAGYKASDDSIEPVLACTRQILSRGNRHQIEVLSRLLAAYHQSTSRQRSDRLQEIKSACQGLQTQPTLRLETLTKALVGWMSLCLPLIVFDIHRGVSEWDFEIPTDDVRALTTNLAALQQYDFALEVTNLSRTILSAIPTAVDQLDEDKCLIESLLLDAKMKPLEDFIDGFESDFGLLSEALKENGFGENATGAASSLRDIFVKVAEAIDPIRSAEPWMLIRDLAIYLNDDVEDPEAASALLVGLVRHGEKVAIMPATLGRLREDLRRIKPKHSPSESRPTEVPRRKVWPVGVALAALALAAFCATALYLSFEKGHWSWLKSFAKTPISSTAAEIEPPVGTGQHFSLGNVRYCHFQEERLRILKEKVRGAEDTRAFNILVVDYNSRCSDFFYQDSDVAIVTAEIAANRQRLADEAERMISTWPGQATVPGK